MPLGKSLPSAKKFLELTKVLIDQGLDAVSEYYSKTGLISIRVGLFQFSTSCNMQADRNLFNLMQIGLDAPATKKAYQSSQKEEHLMMTVGFTNNPGEIVCRALFNPSESRRKELGYKHELPEAAEYTEVVRKHITQAGEKEPLIINSLSATNIYSLSGIAKLKPGPSLFSASYIMRLVLFLADNQINPNGDMGIITTIRNENRKGITPSAIKLDRANRHLGITGAWGGIMDREIFTLLYTMSMNQKAINQNMKNLIAWLNDPTPIPSSL